jgi:hypothetical protein
MNGLHITHIAPTTLAQAVDEEDDEPEPLPCPECEGTGLTGGTPCLNCDGRAFLHPVTGEAWKDETQ